MLTGPFTSPAAAVAHCVRCGTAIATQWRFCRSCGGPLVLPDRDVTRPDDGAAALTTVAAAGRDAAASPRARWGRRLRIAGVIGALLAALCGVAFGAVEDVRAHIALTDTRSTLGTTQANLDRTTGILHTTQDTLKTAEDKLGSTEATLATTQTGLAQRTAERDTLTSQLAAAQQSLAGARNTVQNQQGQLAANSAEIVNLHTCLVGALNAMLAVTNLDFTTATYYLNSVHNVCTIAFNNLPPGT